MCIVNHSHKFIFVHIPKCGGTFVTSFLAQFTRYCDQEIGATHFGESIQPFYEKRFRIRKHSTANDLFRIVGPDVWQEYVTFSILRNPFLRAVSTYKFLKSWRNWPGSAVMDTFGTVDEFVHSDYWQNDGVDQILMPQAKFLAVPQGPALDEIWQLEELSFDRIVARLGLPADSIEYPPVKARNASQAGPALANRLSESSVRLIAARYHSDFVLGGYAFEPPRAIVA